MSESVNENQDNLAGKYLTFKLAGETYGLEILKVQEIIGMMKVTKVPRTPEFIRGVINLRGKVIPVIDLRLKFAMEAAEDTERTCIIVVQVKGESGMLTMGSIVDEVSEVMNIEAEKIEARAEILEDEAVLQHCLIGQKARCRKILFFSRLLHRLSGENSRGNGKLHPSDGKPHVQGKTGGVARDKQAVGKRTGEA